MQLQQTTIKLFTCLLPVQFSMIWHQKPPTRNISTKGSRYLWTYAFNCWVDTCPLLSRRVGWISSWTCPFSCTRSCTDRNIFHKHSTLVTPIMLLLSWSFTASVELTMQTHFCKNQLSDNFEDLCMKTVIIMEIKNMIYLLFCLFFLVFLRQRKIEVWHLK